MRIALLIVGLVFLLQGCQPAEIELCTYTVEKYKVPFKTYFNYMEYEGMEQLTFTEATDNADFWWGWYNTKDEYFNGNSYNWFLLNSFESAEPCSGSLQISAYLEGYKGSEYWIVVYRKRK